MLYILVNIYNLTQLDKLNQGVCLEIRQSFNRLMNIHKQVKLWELNEIIVLDMGPESEVDPQNVLDVSLQIKETLDLEHDSLVGYNIFILVHTQTNSHNLIDLSKSLFLALDHDELIWIRKELISFFKKYAQIDIQGDFATLTSRERAPADSLPAAESNRIPLVAYEPLLAGIRELINQDSDCQAIHFSGPPGSGKSLMMADVLRTLYPDPYAAQIPQCSIRFKKSSDIHPLLNSIQHDLLENMAGYLQKYELSIWEENGFMLNYLMSTIMTEKCPDHIFEDFCICYNLYLAAYLRKMEENLYPALFICDDFERYHKRTSRYLNNLIKDFLTNPLFIPVFITNSESLPEEFAFLKVKTIRAGYPGLKDINLFARFRFPELKLNKDQLKEIKSHTKGEVVPVMLNLLYLDKLRSKQRKVLIQEKLERIIWYLIENLDKNTIDVLFSIYISGGLLPSDELTNFLIAFGLKKETIHQSIELLAYNYLIVLDRFLVPHYPVLRMQLEKNLGKRGSYLKGLIADFIMELWKKRKLSNLVLLFSFFMNNHHTAFAFEILALLIKRKIDENDLAGVKPYLNPENFSFPQKLSGEEKHFLNVIVTSGKIRLFLIDNNPRGAGEIVEQILQEEAEFLPDLFHGELQLNLSRYYLVTGELEKAVNDTKKTLLLFQDLGQRSLSGQAYKILGYTMLMQGKIDDALEYFKLAEKFLDESHYPYDRIQVFLYAAVSCYIRGELSKAQNFIARGRKTAALAGRRSFQLFFNFFQARIYFAYAAYDKAYVLLQKNLTLAHVYSLHDAWLVSYRWIARIEIYRGNIDNGLTILEKLEESRESLFFKSEAYLFQEMYPEAHKALEKALSLGEDTLPLSDETICWSSGFNSIEGKCLAIFTGSSIFNRLLRAFYAYLQGMNGDESTGINSLHLITRTEKHAGLDPHSHLYFFFYAMLLYKAGGPGPEDSLTILNKAVKQLQERASKIDIPLERTKYLNKNFWNKTLLAEGKKRKLL